MNRAEGPQGKADKVILVADYGRSGQGWLSYMLCYILNAKYIEPYDFLKGMLYTTDADVLSVTGGNIPGRERGQYSMVIKTHHYPALNVNLTDKIIFLTRDPRDIAVSAYYRYKVLIDEEPPHSLKEWLFYVVHGVRPFSYAYTAYKWRKYMRLWENRKDLPLHRVRYEDLSADTAGTLRSVLAYLGVSIDEALLAEAVQRFSFQNLARRKKGEENTGNMAFRKGIVGDYRNKFSAVEVRIFNAIAESDLKKCGYGV